MAEFRGIFGEGYIIKLIDEDIRSRLKRRGYGTRICKRRIRPLMPFRLNRVHACMHALPNLL